MDKVPPSNKEIEIAILGTILGISEYQEIMISSLKEDLFYYAEHLTIFRSIKRLYDLDEKIDMLTISQNLRDNNSLDAVGGAYYISTLTSRIGSGTNYETHIRILKELYIKRELLKLFQQETINIIDNSNDIADTYTNVSNELENIFTITDTNIENMYDVMHTRINEVEKLKKGKLLGISSGINSLDSITSGWQESDMIVLAARPSMGKTIVSTLFAKYPVLQGKTILYFSLEMSANRIADRVISLDTGINTKRIQFNNLRSDDWINIHDNVSKYQDLNFLINDQSGITIEEISSISLLQSKKTDIDLIVIDYLGLIKHSLKSGSTNDQVSHISKNIKGLAKKLKCPVIALSQLSRNVESRSDKRPILSDLRDSGSIEQDADLVIFLYRDDYYNENSEDKNKIEVLIRKNRNGELGMTYLYRNDNWSNIRDEEIIEIPEI